MEGSRSQNSRKTSGMGGASPSSSSISELFDGRTSQSGGGLFGYGEDSSKGGVFNPKIMGRESNKHEGTGTERGASEGHSVGSSAHNVNGNNLQKGQNFHGKSQNLSDTFLGSSIFYGGRDLCCDPAATKTEGLHGLKKDNQDDDTNNSNLTSASRGNWWQGSLYY